MNRFKFITIGSLVGLALGFAMGTLAHGADSGFTLALAEWIKPIETIWLGTLRLFVMPLIVSYLVVALVSAVENRIAGKIGAYAILSHASLILFLTLFMLVVSLPVLSNYEISDAARGVFQSTEIDASAGSTPGLVIGFLQSLSDTWLGILYRAIVGVDIVPVLGIALVGSIIVSQLPSRFREPILSVFKWLARASQTAITGMLLIMPLIVFSIILSLTLNIGSEIAGTLGFWIVFVSGMLFASTGLVIFVTSTVARIPMKQLAAALWPVYAIAVASRSSLLCLPAMIETARDRLKLSEHVSGLILPLSVSTFKINMVVSSPVKFIFLVKLYGDVIDPLILGSLILTTIVLSLGTPGLPSGSGGFRSLPIYLAAGIPIEGFMLIAAVDAIPDVFKTIVNVTEDVSVATIVNRFAPETVTEPSVAPLVVETKSSLPD